MLFIHALLPSIVSLYSYDLVLVSTLILDACYVHLYLAYLLLNMSLTLFLDVQTPQVTTMKSRQVRRSSAEEEREWRADDAE